MRAAAGELCWMDLAATDSAAAGAFYERLFGWKTLEQAVGGGRFTRLQLGERYVGSIYQLDATHLGNGVPSHWTPYVRVKDVAAAARRATACGARVVIQPFDVGSLARIALVMDPVGATFGLWETIAEGDGTAPKKG